MKSDTQNLNDEGFWHNYRSLADAAEFLGWSKRSLEDAVRRDPRENGSVPHYTLPCGRSRKFRRFTYAVLDAWMKRGCPAVADFDRLANRKR